MKNTARFRCRSCWHIETFAVREDGSPIFAPVCSHCMSGLFDPFEPLTAPPICDHDNVDVELVAAGFFYGDEIVDTMEMWEVCQDCGEKLEKLQ